VLARSRSKSPAKPETFDVEPTTPRQLKELKEGGPGRMTSAAARFDRLFDKKYMFFYYVAFVVTQVGLAHIATSETGLPNIG
jgi:hypothetical protein